MFGNLGTMELLILALFGLLIFGKRLPEVGKSVGRGIVEFKRGLSGIDDHIDHAAQESRDPQQLEQEHKASEEEPGSRPADTESASSPTSRPTHPST